MALQRTEGSGAARVQFAFDTSNLEEGLRKLIDSVDPKLAAQALFAAGNELLYDAIYIPPQAPKDVGDLRGSARVKVAEISNGRADVLAGFNIAYAAKHHEWPLTKKINWTTDKGAESPGPKYLESKLLMFRDKYLRIIAGFITEALGGKSSTSVGAKDLKGGEAV